METRFKHDIETLEGLGTKAQIRNTGLFYLASFLRFRATSPVILESMTRSCALLLAPIVIAACSGSGGGGGEFDGGGGEFDGGTIDAGSRVDATLSDAGSACSGAVTALAAELYESTQACSVTVRLDYTSKEVKGYQVFCGAYSAVSDSDAAATATGDSGYGTDDAMLNESAPEDAYVFYRAPGDFGGVGAVSSDTGLSVFGGSIIWSGSGEISYPSQWRAAADLESGCDASGGIDSRRGWDLRNGVALDSGDVDSAVAVVLGTAIPAAFWKGGYVFNATVLLYPPTVGAFDPTPAEWVVIVNGGWLE